MKFTGVLFNRQAQCIKFSPLRFPLFDLILSDNKEILAALFEHNHELGGKVSVLLHPNDIVFFLG